MQNLDKLFDNDGYGALYVCVGKSLKGKSYLVRYLLTEKLLHGKLRYGLVFTRTPFTGDFDFLPKTRVIEGYKESILRKYINNLRTIKEKEGNVPPNFLVFDDLVGVLNNQS